MLTSAPLAAGRPDEAITSALNRAGVIGGHLRARLATDLKAKLVLRQGRDAIEIVGYPGTGKHKVVEVAHDVAQHVLGRPADLIRFACDDSDRVGLSLGQAVSAAIDSARGGTVVFEGFHAVRDDQRAQLTRLLRQRSGDALLLAVSDGAHQTAPLDRRPATAIQLAPLHERADDIWELVDHFFAGLAEEGLTEPCLGFSRQAKADLAESVRETSLTSVRHLRDVVRDIVFEVLAEGPLPLKLTSDHVRPYLERTFGQSDAARRHHDADLVASQFDTLLAEGSTTLIEQLAALHHVAPELLRREIEVLRDTITHLDGVPRSYRNIMSKIEDVQRAALWLLTEASTQADFRRFFGDEGFMRPTKSVAWAFYNRVFQRES